MIFKNSLFHNCTSIFTLKNIFLGIYFAIGIEIWFGSGWQWNFLNPLDSTDLSYGDLSSEKRIFGIYSVIRARKIQNLVISFKEAFVAYFLCVAIGYFIATIGNIVIFKIIDPSAKDYLLKGHGAFRSDLSAIDL